MAVCEYCHLEFDPEPGHSIRFCCHLHKERAGIRRWRLAHREARNAAARRCYAARKAAASVANSGDR
jgi:hypothetical protein